MMNTRDRRYCMKCGGYLKWARATKCDTCQGVKVPSANRTIPVSQLRGMSISSDLARKIDVSMIREQQRYADWWKGLR